MREAIFSSNTFLIIISLPHSPLLSLSQAFLRSFRVEMEADPSQPSRFHLDGVQQPNRTERNEKRKLQTDELDFPRPKHKYCWARRFFTEHDSTSDDKLMVKSETYGLASAMFDDDSSEPRSSRGSNGFSEDSDTAISVNEESKLRIDCAKPYLCGRPSYGGGGGVEGLMNLEKSMALGIYTDRVYSEFVKDGTENSIERVRRSFHYLWSES